MTTLSNKKYLTINPNDHKWGLAINSVGYQSISKNEVYPPQIHPTRYLFNTDTGRILNEYQLLYITKGEGTFTSKTAGTLELKEGYMFLLFPGEWHTYRPHSNTGWNEYWIGFNGKIMEQWVAEGFFTKENPVFNIGLNEDIVSLYKRATFIAESQEANYQQALSGIACNLISMALYLSRNRDFNKSNIATKINQAKIETRNERKHQHNHSRGSRRTHMHELLQVQKNIQGIHRIRSITIHPGGKNNNGQRVTYQHIQIDQRNCL